MILDYGEHWVAVFDFNNDNSASGKLHWRGVYDILEERGWTEKI